MQLALITDTHFGWKNDAPLFQDYFNRFYDEIFFPTLRARRIRSVIHGGDLFDRRKYVNFYTLYRTRKEFLENLVDGGFDPHILIGNHDTYFRDSNHVNSVAELCRRLPGVTIYEEPEEVEFDGLRMLFLPWLNPTNMPTGLEMVARSKASVLIGHLELAGFHMDQGTICEHGLDADLFKKFKRVFSGHFHHKSKNGNIQYLGNPYQLTFADLDERRGFHIFDTDTLELEFIENPHTMFHRVTYDDRDQAKHGDILNTNFSQWEGKYLKVVATHKTNPVLFEQYMERVYAANPADVSVIENYSLEIAEEADQMFEGLVNEDGEIQDIGVTVMPDTLTILNKYVDSMEMDIDQQRLKDVLREIYIEAVANAGLVDA